MAKVEVVIAGVSYPCRPTMGAMLRFKKETGKEITEISETNFSDLCTYLYCCVASACAADKVAFGMSLIEFADALAPEQMQAWTTALAGSGESGEGEEKKS